MIGKREGGRNRGEGEEAEGERLEKIERDLILGQILFNIVCHHTTY